MTITFKMGRDAPKYLDLHTEELVRIAFLDSTYGEKAKALAVCELEKRGALANKKSLIKKVRKRMREDEALHEHMHNPALVVMRLRSKLTDWMLVLSLWIGAINLPSQISTPHSTFRDGAGYFIAIGWAVAATIAIKKAKNGERRQLKCIVIVPAVLVAISTALHLL